VSLGGRGTATGMPHLFEAKTLTGLHDSMTLSLLMAEAGDLDLITSVDVQKHNVIGWAESLDWEFDLKTMWLTKSRWSMMARQYLDPELVQAWIDQASTRIGKRGRGTAVLRTKVVKARGGAATGHTNKESRRWGSCMLSLSYKALPKPTITLHSRTSYLGYIGALDLTVAWMLGKYLAAEIGIDAKDMQFVWMIESIQWHNFKSLAWALNNADEEIRQNMRRLMIKPVSKLTEMEQLALVEAPGLNMSRKWLRKIMLSDAREETYGDMSYNTYRRIRRRWHTEVLGYDKAQAFEGWSYYKTGPKAGEQKEFFKAYQPLPSCPAHTLDLSAINMPFGKRYGGDYVDGADDMEDDDDE